MPNKNYLSGRRKEYKIKKFFEKYGWIVLRTAGSHGFADLIAIEPNLKHIRFIQCKPDKFSNEEIKRLKLENDFVTGQFICAFEVR